MTRGLTFRHLALAAAGFATLALVGGMELPYAAAWDTDWQITSYCDGSTLKFRGTIHNAYTEDLHFRYLASTTWAQTQVIPAGETVPLYITTTVNPEHAGDITFADHGSTFASGAAVLLHPVSIHLTWTAGECGVVASTTIPAIDTTVVTLAPPTTIVPFTSSSPPGSKAPVTATTATGLAAAPPAPPQSPTTVRPLRALPTTGMDPTAEAFVALVVSLLGMLAIVIATRRRA